MKTSKLVAIALLALLASISLFSADQKPLKIIIGPEQIIMRDQLQPGMFQSSQGTLLLHAAQVARSTDGGKTWKPWTPTTRKGLDFIEAVELKDGTVLGVGFVPDGPMKDGYLGARLWESHDDMQTFDGPIPAKVYLPDSISGFSDNGQPDPGFGFHRTVLEMPNGDLLATAYGWFKGDATPSDYQPTMNKTRCFLLRSKDRGRNWALVSTIAADSTVGEEGFGEPVLLRISSPGQHQGRFIVHMRTGRLTPTYQTESDDDGKTWTKPHPLPWHGVDPDLIEMRNGIVVAGFGWRTKESLDWRPKAKATAATEEHTIGREHGNYLAFSLDQGTTWTQITQVNHELTTSYVTVREVAPGKLLLVYDKGWWGRKDCAIAGRFITVRR